MANNGQGQHVRAGANTGGIKGSLPKDDEGVLTPGMMKGAGGDEPPDIGNASGREDPRERPHLTTSARFTREDVAPEE